MIMPHFCGGQKSHFSGIGSVPSKFPSVIRWVGIVDLVDVLPLAAVACSVLYNANDVY